MGFLAFVLAIGTIFTIPTTKVYAAEKTKISTKSFSLNQGAVCTFVEGYNWNGKTLITYCTGNSSGAGDSAAEIGRFFTPLFHQYLESTFFDSSLTESAIVFLSFSSFI